VHVDNLTGVHGQVKWVALSNATCGLRCHPGCQCAQCSGWVVALSKSAALKQRKSAGQHTGMVALHVMPPVATQIRRLPLGVHKMQYLWFSVTLDLQSGTARNRARGMC